MEPHVHQVETEGQGQWPVINGVRLPDTRLGTTARWGRVSSLIHYLSFYLTELHVNHTNQGSPGYLQGRQKP